MEISPNPQDEVKNPIVERVLSILRQRATRRQRGREEKKFKLECERLTEKWRNAIEADPEMKGIRFALKIGPEPVKIINLGRDDEDEVLTKQDLVFQAVYERLSPPHAYSFNPESNKLRERDVVNWLVM